MLVVEVAVRGRLVVAAVVSVRGWLAAERGSALVAAGFVLGVGLEVAERLVFAGSVVGTRLMLTVKQKWALRTGRVETATGSEALLCLLPELCVEAEDGWDRRFRHCLICLGLAPLLNHHHFAAVVHSLCLLSHSADQ